MTKTVLIGIPVLLIGGTEVQTLSVVKVLVSGGYRVAVCCYHEYLPEVVEKFRSAGAEVILLNLQRQTSLPGLLGLIPSLIKAFRVVKPDVIHVQYIAPGLLSIVAARLARVPVVFSTVHIAGDLIYGSKAKWMLRFASIIPTAFICVSKDVERFWFGDARVFDADHSCANRHHLTIARDFVAGLFARYGLNYSNHFRQTIPQVQPVNPYKVNTGKLKRMIGRVPLMDIEKLCIEILEKKFQK